MNYLEESEIKDKQFDIKIMKRLLGYAKPYALLLVLSFLAIILATGVDLARPYIIKVTVDNYIAASDEPMTAFTDMPENLPYTHFNDLYFVRINDLEGAEGEYQILSRENAHYLIEGVIPRNSPFEIREGYIAFENQEYSYILLSQDEYLQFRENDFTGVRNMSLLLFLVLVGGFFFNYMQVYLLSYTGQRVIHSMRNELYSHVLNLPLKFFNKNPVGRLVTRVTNDMENLNELYTSVIVSFFKDIFLLLGIIIMMLSLSTEVSLVVFITLPIVVFASMMFRKKARAAYREVRRKLAVINSSLSENISGMGIIQIFAQEDRKYEEFFKINSEHKEASLRELFVFAIFRPTIDLIYYFALALLIWYGGGAVIRGSIQFGVLFAFISYLDQFFQPISDLSEKFNIMQSAMASSERIFELLDEKDGLEDSENVKEPFEFKGEVEFKNVWFSYDDEQWVLEDVSFKIEKGQTVAFVGATGSGKTTIISLIARLYEIQKGDILIDKVSIKDIPVKYLRKNVASVLQDVFLFTGDMRSNIRLNNAEISDEKVEEVSRFVNAHHFISKLKDGYNSLVEEGGSTLSSGERQLLAFARALAFDPKILILDEATSNIDTQTEVLIQEAIEKVIKGRTTIVVAHRLSTIQHSDNIIVMHKGKIREMGRHDELLKQKGLYHNLYLLQYKE
ncbi:ABC-type multidrug transport system fused ATPase/permease subunit [Acetoanaerobium pronyense]|uniref:ABC-type multidrug transport system fused ATPase/permease subunit n=1 Tax=Acetoanaerobium pronyense TaxID=1482736 RepID=A0ABS4KKS7_9FIRM|nr:ABC transporter ATP-binding protein [Acetoanaerobium pronyense]MBP2027229.1 ABC-type multidrug transport system fused ATPase/permease subunit [Acetoanaerobium pronyense]